MAEGGAGWWLAGREPRAALDRACHQTVCCYPCQQLPRHHAACCPNPAKPTRTCAARLCHTASTTTQLAMMACQVERVSGLGSVDEMAQHSINRMCNTSLLVHNTRGLMLAHIPHNPSTHLDEGLLEGVGHLGQGDGVDGVGELRAEGSGAADWAWWIGWPSSANLALQE